MLDEKDFQDWNIWRPAKRNYLNSLKKNYERQKRMKKNYMPNLFQLNQMPLLHKNHNT